MLESAINTGMTTDTKWTLLRWIAIPMVESMPRHAIMEMVRKDRRKPSLSRCRSVKYPDSNDSRAIGRTSQARKKVVQYVICHGR